MRKNPSNQTSKFKWFATIGIAAVGAAALIFLYGELMLPTVEPLKAMPLQTPLKIFTRDGKLIGEYGQERRSLIQRKDIPKPLIDALIATEDQRFYEHNGVDFFALLRAATQLVKTGQKLEGGGTITMQVARNYFLSPEKYFIRKFNEILLAWKIERKLTKDEILVLYVNKIYMGYRAYGMAAAAQAYYGKNLNQLSLPEMAMLAGIPKAPSAINPLANPVAAKERRNHVLERMVEEGFITEETYQKAAQQPLDASYHGVAIDIEAPYIAEMVRNEMVARFGQEDAYSQGYRVFTTIDSDEQRYANQALRAALIHYDRRHGFRKPTEVFEPVRDGENWTVEQAVEWMGKKSRIGNLYGAIVLEVLEKEVKVLLANGKTATVLWQGLSWAKPYVNADVQGASPETANDIVSPGDKVFVYLDKNTGLQLAQTPEVNGAFVALDANNGAIRALVGGFDYFENNYNRSTQAKRQPGSSFKPFVYSAALEKGYTPASIINDAPIVFEGGDKVWRPENYTREFSGPIRLREALAKSRNLASVRLLQQVGVSSALKYLERFGFQADKLPPNLTLALGSGEVTQLELTRGFAVFANGGYRVEPYLIERIQNVKGEVIEKANPVYACEGCEPKAERAISEENAYIMRSMLRDVIEDGTAYRAKSLGRADLSGKTGTTNNETDAWFVGFNSDLVAASWVGFDQPSTLGNMETGGRVALPMWMIFMANALNGKPERPPKQPAGIVTAKIDPKTGAMASLDQADAIFEYFHKDNVPTQKEEKTSSRSWLKIPEQLF